jgi:hypothetical protein
MSRITKKQIEQYVSEHISIFHENRLHKLKALKFEDVLRRKNPYLFKAKNILTAESLVRHLLDAYLSAQEEGIFGNFLEALAVFICTKVYGGKKTKTVGIDLEFEKDGTYYFVSIKSGPNWANSDQANRMKQNFAHATEVHQAAYPKANVVCVNGCCYGKDHKPQKAGYQKLCGQCFWEFISGNPNLYLDIIEPLGYKAKEKNEAFQQAYSEIINIFTFEFMKSYCDDGKIDWAKTMQLNSGA